MDGTEKNIVSMVTRTHSEKLHVRSHLDVRSLLQIICFVPLTWNTMEVQKLERGLFF